MPGVERLARGGVLDRDLFLLELGSPEAFPDSLALASPRFACLLAWDARGVEPVRIESLARRLLDEGAVYVCAWGPDCERVHDIIDEVNAGASPPPVLDRVVMTTWHENEPLSEAIWFVLNYSFPDEGYTSGCSSTLGVAIGSSEYGGEIRRAFSA